MQMKLDFWYSKSSQILSTGVEQIIVPYGSSL